MLLFSIIYSILCCACIAVISHAIKARDVKFYITLTLLILASIGGAVLISMSIKAYALLSLCFCIYDIIYTIFSSKKISILSTMYYLIGDFILWPLLLVVSVLVTKLYKTDLEEYGKAFNKLD